MKHTPQSLLEMTKTAEGMEHIRVMVAELCGWKYHGSINGSLLMWPPSGGDAMEPPEYPSDLNAMADAERRLASADDGGQSPWAKYRQTLWPIAAGKHWQDFHERVAILHPKHTTRGQAFHWALPVFRAIAFVVAKQTS